MIALAGWLNPMVVGYAFGVVVSLLILLFAVKIPLKKKYHYGFIVFVLLAALYLSAGMYSQLAGSVDEYGARVWWEYALGPPVQLPALCYFLLLFLRPRLGRARYLLYGTIAYALLWVGIAVIQPARLYVQPGEVPTGFMPARGDLIVPLLALGLSLFLPIIALALRESSAQQSKFTKDQFRYVLGGIVLYTLGPVSQIVSQELQTISVQPYFLSAGMTMMLLGLGKHGFFSVKPIAQAPSLAPLNYDLPPGVSYLVLEPNPSRAFRIFSDLIRHDRLGLCVTRSPPESVRQLYQLETTPIRWLAEIGRDEALAPGDLVGLSLTVQDFLQNAARPVVILHGLEYLVSINEFRPVLRLVQRLNDVNAERGGVLLLPLVPRSLEERDEALLRAECFMIPDGVLAQ